MTREEAIDLLDNLIGFVEDNHGSDYDEALKIAIKALKKQSYDDCISRRAVMDALRKMMKPYGDGTSIYDNGNYIHDETLADVHQTVEELPSVTPKPKTGHWIKNEESLYCSFCGCGALYDKVYPGESVFGKVIRVDSTFCPTCGAKMNAESEDK